MGLGGILMWTAVGRALRTRYPEKKIALATKPTWRARIRGRKYGTLIDSEILINNDDFATTEKALKGGQIIYAYTDTQESSYLESFSSDVVVFKKGGHVIDILCHQFGIKNPEQRCVLRFTDAELQTAERHARHFGNYIVVEPHAKDSFTPNKGWQFESWQEVVDDLSRYCRIVQIGAGGLPVLKNVNNLTGAMSFRETAAFMARSRLFLSTEGGLMHAANAVGIPAVIVFGGYTPVYLTGYAGHIQLASDLPCAPCGRRRACDKGQQCMKLITPAQVIAAAQGLLNKT